MSRSSTSTNQMSKARSLLLSSTSSDVLSTPRKEDVSIHGNNVAHFTVINNTYFFNVSDASTTQASDGNDQGVPGGLVALLVGLIGVGAAIVSLLLYLKITEKLYRLLPFKVKATKRRSSSSSSHRPLDVDDAEDEGQREGDLPATREVSMFTIDDFEPIHQDDIRRPTSQEEYFYDEVFGQSMFEDEATNASMRQLYLINEQDDDMFDVDTILSSIPGIRNTTSTTSPTTTTSGRKMS